MGTGKLHSPQPPGSAQSRTSPVFCQHCRVVASEPHLVISMGAELGSSLRSSFSYACVCTFYAQPRGWIYLFLFSLLPRQSPTAKPPAGIAAFSGGYAGSAGRPGERAGVAGWESPLTSAAAEAAEMLDCAARPTAASTFSGDPGTSRRGSWGPQGWGREEKKGGERE